MNQKTFPIILIILDLCASFAYASKGDMRMAIYWFSAATLNATIVF